MTAATGLGPVVACPVCRHGVRLHGDVGCTRGDCECSMSRADLGSATPVQAEVSVAPSGRTLDLLDPACARCTHRRGRHAQQGYSVPCSRCACRNFTTEAADAPAAPPAEATPPPAVAAPAPAAPAAEAGDVAEAPRPAGPALRTPRRIDPRPAVERALVPAAVVGGGGAGEEVAAAVGHATALDSLGVFLAELHERAFYLVRRSYCRSCVMWGPVAPGPCKTCGEPMEPVWLATVPREI